MTGSKDPAVKPLRTLPGFTVQGGYTRHPFDAEHGVRTSGLVAGRFLKSGHRHDRHSTAYFGVAPSVFHALLARWQRSKPTAALEEFTFVDVGAGLGRAVMLAAELPFRAVMGVELHPGLARAARRNLAVWRKAGKAIAPMRIACEDATAFRMPQGPCLAFLFNPFGVTVMQRVLNGWSKAFAQRAQMLDILYVNDEQVDVLAAQPGLRRLFRGRIRRSRVDVEADRLIMDNQPDGEYAVTATEMCSIYRWMGR